MGSLIDNIGFCVYWLAQRYGTCTTEFTCLLIRDWACMVIGVPCIYATYDWIVMLVKPVLNIIKIVLPKHACLAKSVRLMIDEYSSLKNVTSSTLFTLFLYSWWNTGICYWEHPKIWWIGLCGPAFLWWCVWDRGVNVWPNPWTRYGF